MFSAIRGIFSAAKAPLRAVFGIGSKGGFNLSGALGRYRALSPTQQAALKRAGLTAGGLGAGAIVAKNTMRGMAGPRMGAGGMPPGGIAPGGMGGVPPGY